LLTNLRDVLQTNEVDAQLTVLSVESRQFSATTSAFNLPDLHLAPPLGVTSFEFLASEN